MGSRMTTYTPSCAMFILVDKISFSCDKLIAMVREESDSKSCWHIGLLMHLKLCREFQDS